MPTQLLAPDTAAANTADQTVPSGGSLTFGLYTTAGGPIPNGVVVPIARKNPAGTYDLTGVVMTAAKPNAVMAAAGVFRAQKPLTDAAIGVQVD